MLFSSFIATKNVLSLLLVTMYYCKSKKEETWRRRKNGVSHKKEKKCTHTHKKKKNFSRERERERHTKERVLFSPLKTFFFISVLCAP